MKNVFKTFGIIAFVAVIGFFFVACSGGDDDNGNGNGNGNGNTPSVSSFAGTWNASGGRSIVFSGSTFNYKVNGTTMYSGTFSVSGSTITFNTGSGTASGNFSLSGNTLTLSNNSWDSSVDGTYTKDNGSSGTGTAPTITTTALTGGTVGTTYSQTLSATGDTPITWSLDSGTLPTGLNIGTTGIISGTPSTAGTSNFTVKATNAAGNDTKQLSITIGGGSDDPGTPLTVTDTTSWTAAINTITNGGNGTDTNYKRYTITVNGTVSVPGRYGDSAFTFRDVRYIEVILKGDGTLQLNSNGCIVGLQRNQKLIIDSATLTLRGKTQNSSVVVGTGYGGAIELKNGIITGNGGYGCGVYITGVNSNPGTFTMSGGTITGNSGEKSAVVIETGIFTMSGGTISGNTNSYDDGGGVNLGGVNTTFTMTGGTISNNTVSGNSKSGGGVYLSGNTTSFTMSGGTISGNTAAFGGGVAARNRSTFNMSGGTISGNTAKSIYGGGGLYLDSNNTYGDAVITFIKTGGSITADNTVTGSSIVGKVACWSVLGGDVYYRDTALGTGDNVTINAGTEPSSLGWTKK